MTSIDHPAKWQPAKWQDPAKWYRLSTNQLTICHPTKIWHPMKMTWLVEWMQQLVLALRQNSITSEPTAIQQFVHTTIVIATTSGKINHMHSY
jgi:hypothetical protein